MSKTKWTLKDLPDLKNKTVLITGANSGLGYEASKALAEAGAEVIMACRSLARGNEAKKTILANNPSANIKVEELDLADQKSIHSFANNINREYQKLDVLLNNAGIMMPPYQLTKDGFESQMGTNHLGHFALTAHLMDLIKKTPGSRVVTVSSLAHKNGDMDFDNLLFEDGKDYSPSRAYGRSKLANLLFTYELQRYFEDKGIDAISVAAHPGIAMTNLAKSIGPKWLYLILVNLVGWMMPSAAKGALPEIRAAADPAVKGGEYYGPHGFNEISGYPVKVQSTALSHDVDIAKRLWKVSEELTKTKFD